MQADGRDSEVMPKVDLAKDKHRLKVIDMLHMKDIEALNIERALKTRQTRKRCNILGICLALGVVGIYAYTIRAVRQETFLDDFNEPETVIEIPSSKNNTL